LERILRVLVPPERMPEATAQEAQKPPAIRLRSEPQTVSRNEAVGVFKFHFDEDGWWRPLEYIQNEYEDQGDVVVDHATGLIWQKSGSPEPLIYADAQKYVEELNHQQFAGHKNWRLPTIPELMSLLEPEEQVSGLYIKPIFDNNQTWCWSVDRLSEDEGGSSGAAWGVDFGSGLVYWRYDGCVRCVCSWQ
jgi:hypothetical protein